jgi:hypothetical protein
MRARLTSLPSTLDGKLAAKNAHQESAKKRQERVECKEQAQKLLSDADRRTYTKERKKPNAVAYGGGTDQVSRMRRRTFLGLPMLAIAARPIITFAQVSAQRPLIAVVIGTSQAARSREVPRQVIATRLKPRRLPPRDAEHRRQPHRSVTCARLHRRSQRPRPGR